VAQQMSEDVFQVSTRQAEGEAIVVLSGELDLAGAEEFDEALRLARVPGRTLTIDLTGLDFIDSSGLSVLVRFHNAATTDGFAYRLLAGPPQVHRTFVLSGLDRTLSFATADRP
jgi:anti-sigma B factor antagonist